MSRDEFLTFSTGSNARTAQLPRDLQLLITDTLESPGTFLLTYFIAKALRHKVKRNVVFVGVSNDLEGLESILKKMVSFWIGVFVIRTVLMNFCREYKLDKKLIRIISRLLMDLLRLVRMMIVL